MTPAFQTLLALGLVALAGLLLLRSFLRKRKQPGCDRDCGAVGPEIKQLQSRLKR